MPIINPTPATDDPGLAASPSDSPTPAIAATFATPAVTAPTPEATADALGGVLVTACSHGFASAFPMEEVLRNRYNGVYGSGNDPSLCSALGSRFSAYSDCCGSTRRVGGCMSADVMFRLPRDRCGPRIFQNYVTWSLGSAGRVGNRFDVTEVLPLQKIFDCGFPDGADRFRGHPILFI